MLIKNPYLMVRKSLIRVFSFQIIKVYLDIQYELSTDLQRVLDDDLVLLQQQIESIKLEQLHNDLKSLCERIEKQPSMHRALTIPFFAGPNASSGMIMNFGKISSQTRWIERCRK